MRPLKDFEDFIKDNTITKINPDISRASSLIKDSKKAYVSLKYE